MYCEAFGLRCLPFDDRIDPEFLFPTPEWEETLAALEYECRQGNGAMLVVGEAGSGKTLLLRTLLARMHPWTSAAVVTCSPATRSHLIREVCRCLHVTLPANSSRSRRLVRLRKHLLRRSVSSTDPAVARRMILIVDQAENLSRIGVSELAALDGLEGEQGRLMTILLCGQPRIKSILNQCEHASLKERFLGERVLRPLTASQTREYIRYRLRQAGAVDERIIEEEALSIIAHASAGNPRRINRICDAAMLAAYGGGQAHIDGALAASVAGPDAVAHPPSAGSPWPAGGGRHTDDATPANPSIETRGSMEPSQSKDRSWADPVNSLLTTGTQLLDRLESALASGGRMAEGLELSVARQQALEARIEELTVSSDRAAARLERILAQTSDASRGAERRCEEARLASERRMGLIRDRFERAAVDAQRQTEDLERARVSAEQAASQLTDILRRYRETAAATDEKLPQLNDALSGLQEKTEQRLREFRAALQSAEDQRLEAIRQAAEEVARRELGRVESKVAAACDRITASVRQSEQELLRLAEQTRAASAARADLQAAAQGVDTTITRAHEQVASHRLRFTEDSAGVAGLSAEIQKLLASVVDGRDQLAREYAIQMERSDAAIAAVRASTEQAETAEKILRGHLDVMQSACEQVEALAAQTARSDRVCTEIRKRQADSEEILLNLAESAATAERARRELACQAESAQGHTADLTTLLDRVHRESRETLAELAGAQDGIRRLIEKTQSDEARRQGAEAASAQLEAQVARGRELLDRLTNSITESGASSERSQAEFADSIARFKELLTELSIREEKANHLNQATARRLEELTRAQAALDQTEQQTREVQGTLDALDFRNAEARDTAENLKGLLQAAERQRNALDTMVASARGAVGDLESKYRQDGDWVQRLTEARNQAGAAVTLWETVSQTERHAVSELLGRVNRATETAIRQSEQAERVAEALAEERTRAEEASAALHLQTQDAGQARNAVEAAVRDASQQMARTQEQRNDVAAATTRLEEVRQRAQEILERAEGPAGLPGLVKVAEHAVKTAAERIGRLSTDFLSLDEKANLIAQRLAEANENAAEWDTRQAKFRDSTDAAHRSNVELTRALDSAETRTRELAEGYAQAGQVVTQIGAFLTEWNSAKECGPLLRRAVNEASALQESLQRLVGTNAENLRQLGEANDAAQELIGRHQEVQRSSSETMQRAAQELAAQHATMEMNQRLLAEFIQRTEQLADRVEELNRSVLQQERYIEDVARKPQEILNDTRAQTEKLLHVCAAVRKVFAQLAQTTLEARQQSASLQDADHAARQLAGELSRVGQSSAVLIREWVQEAARTQSRLQTALRQCPAIEATHPSDVLHPWATQSRTSTMNSDRRVEWAPPVEANPSVPRVNAGRAEAPHPLPPGVPHPDEISQLLEEAKQTAAVVLP